MKVFKWGNSLAVRLPAVVVEGLDLKEGDEIEISIAGKRDFKVARDRFKERALEQLRQMKWSFPRISNSTVKRSMNDKPFFDTNVILYAFRRDDRRGPVAET
jgi:antitoxin MazE